MNSLTPLLILAFLGSGLIAVLVPDSFFAHPVTQGWSGMFLMLLVGIPFYVCATTSTPIVAALLMKGLSPGAALVFLLAGPATNLGTILAVWGYLGKRVMVIYLVCMAGLTLLMGGMVDSIYRDYGIPVEAIVGQATHFVPEAVKVAAFIFLLILMALSMKRTRLLNRWGEKLRSWCRPIGFDPLSRRAQAFYVVLLILLYLSTGLSKVEVGEVGWILNLGEVARDASGEVVTHEPGLCFHLPFPFQTMRTGRSKEVQILTFGFRRDTGREDPAMEAAAPALGDPPMEVDLPAEAEVMNGEESLVSLKFSIQYRPKDPYAYYFSFDDPDRLIQAYASAALRTVCARRSTQDILVGHRRELEQATRGLLQSELDRIACGVEILRASFVDVHAPPEVHFAFRDVASAAEDKHQQELLGEGASLKTLADARGRAYRIEEEAKSQGHLRTEEAHGRAAAFQGRASAYRAFKELTRLRMWLEALDKILGRAETVVYSLHEGIDVDLWIQSPEGGSLPFLGDEQQEKRRGSEAPEAPKAEENSADKPKPPDWYKLFQRR
jgi:membrane protease subunit HflK